MPRVIYHDSQGQRPGSNANCATVGLRVPGKIRSLLNNTRPSACLRLQDTELPVDAFRRSNRIFFGSEIAKA